MCFRASPEEKVEVEVEEEGTKNCEESTFVPMDNYLLYLDPQDIDVKKKYASVNLQQEAQKTVISIEKKS